MRYTDSMYSKAGIIIAGLYLALAAYLIGTQGLFGESFITLILGMPWTLGLAYFEYFSLDGTAVYALALLPIALNAVLLYWIAARLTRHS